MLFRVLGVWGCNMSCFGFCGCLGARVSGLSMVFCFALLLRRVLSELKRPDQGLYRSSRVLPVQWRIEWKRKSEVKYMMRLYGGVRFK